MIFRIALSAIGCKIEVKHRQTLLSGLTIRMDFTCRNSVKIPVTGNVMQGRCSWGCAKRAALSSSCQDLCRRRMRRKKALASARTLRPLVQYMAVISEEVVGGSNLAEYHHR